VKGLGEVNTAGDDDHSIGNYGCRDCVTGGMGKESAVGKVPPIISIRGYVTAKGQKGSAGGLRKILRKR